MLHCGLLTITNKCKQRERGMNKSGNMLNDLHNQPTNQRKVYLAQLTEVLHYAAVPQNWMKEETPITGEFSPMTYAKEVCYVKLMGEYSPTMYEVKVLL